MEAQAILVTAERLDWPQLSGALVLAGDEISWRTAMAASTPKIRADAGAALEKLDRELTAAADERAAEAAHQRQLAEDGQDRIEREAIRIEREAARPARIEALLERIANALETRGR